MDPGGDYTSPMTPIGRQCPWQETCQVEEVQMTTSLDPGEGAGGRWLCSQEHSGRSVAPLENLHRTS